jgi:hypothetical protein
LAGLVLISEGISVHCHGSSKESFMATGQRTKRNLKSRPKYRRERSLATRRRKAKSRAAHKRGLNRSRARRRNK